MKDSPVTYTLEDQIVERFLKAHPKEATAKISDMSPRIIAKNLESFTPTLIAPIMRSLSPTYSSDLVMHLSDKYTAEAFEQLDTNTVISILSRLSKKKVGQILKFVGQDFQEEIIEMMGYPDDVAGSLMDVDIMMFNHDQKAGDLVKFLRNKNLKAYKPIYIIDDERNLLGRLDIQKIIAASSNEKLGTLLMSVPVTVGLLEPKTAIFDKFNAFRVNFIPVVDGNEKLVGVISASVLYNSFEEEIGSDMQMMVGVSKDERALSSFWFAFQKRQPWLQINLLTAFLAAAVVGMFEGIISQYTALAILLPIAAGQAGNTGAQSLAVVMRGLTLREITVRNWMKVVIKEFSAGVLNGIAISITCGICVYMWSSNTGLALIIALAMISSMCIAATAGALVPLVLKRMGQDPALSSSIILTTITDVAGFMAFLGIATLLSFML